MEVGEVNVKLTLTEAELAAAIDKSIAKLKLFEKAAGGSDSAIASLGRGIKTAGEHIDKFAKFASIAAAALAVFTVKMNKVSDEVDETAQALGISIGKLQEFRAAVAVAGGSPDQLNAALNRFGREMGDATTNITPFRVALGQLGLTIEDLRRLKFDEALELVRDRLSRVNDTTRQMNIGNELFGRSQQKVANFLRMTSEEAANNKKELEKLGLVLSDDIIKKGGEAADKTELLGLQLKTAGQKIAAEMLPVIKQMNAYLSSKEGQAQVDALAKGIKNLVQYMIDNKETILLVTGAIGGALVGGRAGPAGALIGATAGILLMAKMLHEARDAAKDAQKATEELGNAGEKAGLQLSVGLGGRRPAPEIFPQIDDAIKELEVKRKLMMNMLPGMADEFPGGLKGFNLPKVDAMNEAAGGVDNLREAFADYNAQLIANQMVDVRKSVLTETEVLQEELDKRLAMLTVFETTRQGQEEKFAGLRAKVQQKASTDIALAAARQYSTLASVVDTSMSQIQTIVSQTGGTTFQLMKGLAMATALVHGYAAVIAAYKAGLEVGGPYALALGTTFAAIAAAGVAAQIANIARTQPQTGGGSGGGIAGPVGGGGAAAAADAAGAGGGGGANAGQTLYINGLNRSDLYSGDAVRDLARAIIQYQRDGGRVMLNG